MTIKITLENLMNDEFGNPFPSTEQKTDEFGNLITSTEQTTDEFGNKNESQTLKDQLGNFNKENEIKNNEDEELEKYIPNEELVSYIIKKYKIINEENIKRKQPPLSIYTLSQICRAARIFEMKKIENVTNEMLIDFCLIMILNNELEKNNLKIPEPIKKFLFNLPDEPPNDDNTFFYKDSESLKYFMAIVHAASIINIPLCIFTFFSNAYIS